MTAYIELKDVSKKFNHFTAVNQISFNVEKGQVIGFLGPNGAGKTTTMRMITGFLAPTSGSIQVMGLSVADQAVRTKSHIGYLPEGAPLYGDLSPRMLLDFIGRARRLDRAFMKERLDFVIQHLHLEQVLDQAIDTLSKGFKRRVGLAQALLHDPDILILDEPTDGLDPVQKHEVRSLITTISPNKAIIISTHILEEVEAICDHTLIIHQGKIITRNTPQELLDQDPIHHAILLQISDGNEATIRSELQTLPFVESVTYQALDQKIDQFTILPKNRHENILHHVSTLAHQKNWSIESLSVVKGTLDQVFRNIIHSTKAY